MFAALRSPREVVFGAGQRAALPAVVRQLGQRVFICADPHVAQMSQFQECLHNVAAAGVDVCVHTDVVPDLPSETIPQTVSRARKFGADVIVGFGGGSCLDLAKVTSLLLTHGGRTEDYYGEFRVPGPVYPVVAVPTTAGTGSEVTPVAVLNDPGRTTKIGISSPYLIPHAALCDPELTYSCPPAVTASAGADALTHCVEAFTAVRRVPATAGLTHERVFVGRGEITDALALLGLEHIIAGLPAAFRRPDDLAAREHVMLGSLLGGLAFGTSGTAAAHAIQYPIGALTHTTHGVGVGVLLPAVMVANREACIPQFARIARMLGNENADDEQAATDAPRAVKRFLSSVGIPAGLADLGVPSDRLEWVAEQSMQAARLVENNPVPLSASSVLSIVQSAYAPNQQRSADTVEVPKG